MRVLVAEDDRTTLALLERILRSLGHEHISVTNGKDALEVLSKADAPAVAILDWVMPHLTGVEVCRQVRARRREEYLYLIMLTSRTGAEEVLFGLASGADDYLKKPVSNEELSARLRTAERIITQDQKLRRLLGQHAAVLQTIPSALIVTDENDKIIEWNQHAERLTGISRDVALHAKITELSIDWEWPEILYGIAECWDSRRTVRLPSIHAMVPSLDHPGRILDLTVTPLADAKGLLPSVLLVASDVTEHRILQEQLFLAQKLESVGRLSAGVAHEINTPSQFIKNNLLYVKSSLHELVSKAQSCGNSPSALDNAVKHEVMEEVSSLSDELSGALEGALDGINRVSEIVRAISGFVHPEDVEKYPVNLHQLIDGCLTMTRHVWKSTATIKRAYSKSVSEVPCYRTGLQQVIINLIVNAAHALQDKPNGSGEKIIEIGTTSTQGHVGIKIEDNGVGIPEENLTKIFDPFYTTKEVGRGTGQGLTLAHQIITQRHGGSLEVVSKVGVGTSVFIVLPLVPSDIADRGNSATTSR